MITVPQPRDLDLEFQLDVEDYIAQKQEAAIVIGDSYEIRKTECEICFSLQECLTNGVDSRCADWQACRKRQQENKQETPALLTPADQAALLERMEIMQADMERLKRIVDVARVYKQTKAILDQTDENRAIYRQRYFDMCDARDKLIEVASQCAIS